MDSWCPVTALSIKDPAFRRSEDYVGCTHSLRPEELVESSDEASFILDRFLLAYLQTLQCRPASREDILI